MIDADAAHLRDLGDVARGEAAYATPSAYIEVALELATAFLYGLIDADEYMSRVEDWMSAVALIDDKLIS